MVILQKQAARRAAAPWPEPPNGNSRGWGPRASPGTRRRTARPSLAPPTGAPSPTAGAGPRPPQRGERGAEPRGRRLPGRGSAPTARRRPHLRRPPGTRAGRGARRPGQSYSLGKRGRPGRAPAPGAAAKRQLRSPRPAGLRSAGNRRRRRRHRGFPGKKQTLAKTSLLNRPCCLPGGERQGPAAQPDKQLGQPAAAQGGQGRARARLRLWKRAGGGPGRGRHSRVRVSPLRPWPPALPHSVSAAPARLIPPLETRSESASALTADRREQSGTAGEAVTIWGNRGVGTSTGGEESRNIGAEKTLRESTGERGGEEQFPSKLSLLPLKIETKAFLDPFEVCGCKIPDDTHTTFNSSSSVVKFIKVY
ncbi:uncharacterized protein LOC144296600 [Canis aureus]